MLVDAERLLEELLLFLEMDRLQTSRNGSTGRAASVQDVTAVMVLGGIEQGLDTRLGVAPWAGVQRLFLCPHDVPGVGVAVKVFLQLSPREGMQLLNAGDRSVSNSVGLTVLRKCSVHLARAQNHTLDLLGLVDRLAVGRVRDDPLEVRVTREVFNIGAGDRVAQERLGEEDNEG